VSFRLNSGTHRFFHEESIKSVRETFHIETLEPEGEGGRVIRRMSVRVETVDAAKERALRVFQQARVPQARGPKVDTVRVLNGAGYEVFSVSARD
jgi:hypothetical protein